MKVAVLAVQSAFIEHEKMLQDLGIECVELRKKENLQENYQGIVLPGGESTVQGKLLKELDMYDYLQGQIKEGMPVLATCAGLILLAEKLAGDETVHFGTLPVTVKRNAYGRQLGSFSVEEEVKGIGRFPMVFIRAPYIEQINGVIDGDNGVQVVSKVQERIVGVQYKNQMAYSFHPELTNDTRIHEKFVAML